MSREAYQFHGFYEASIPCQYQSVCPIDSPWRSETPPLENLEGSASINLDDFMPLKDLLDVDLQSLNSTASEQSNYGGNFQVSRNVDIQ